MMVNVDSGKIDKECELNRSNGCCGCEHYYNESDIVCKRGCIYYLRKIWESVHPLNGGVANSACL